jgi:hypothetical protein
MTEEPHYFNFLSLIFNRPRDDKQPVPSPLEESSSCSSVGDEFKTGHKVKPLPTNQYQLMPLQINQEDSRSIINIDREQISENIRAHHHLQQHLADEDPPSIKTDSLQQDNQLESQL